MGKTDDDGGLSAEVTNRLDELFAEDDDSIVPDQEFAPKDQEDPEGPAGADIPELEKSEKNSSTAETAVEDTPAKELKALVFGIDWEITDETMVAFLNEVRRLRTIYADDKILSTFLKLHESIGKYIKAKKVQAHPDAIKFVTSVFRNFEKVLTSPEMPESRKKRLLAGDIKIFKETKELVIAQEKASKPRPDTEASKGEQRPPEFDTKPAADVQTPELNSELNQEALDYIVGELKKVIRDEFKTMHQILKNLGA